MSWPRVLLLVAIAGIAGALLRRAQTDEVIGAAAAIDGDSVRILDRDIRLQGIDAPEYRQTCQGEAGEVACGRDARRALAGLAGRGLMRCRIAGRDRFGRDLAHCRVGDLDVNATMVRDGHALAFGEYRTEEAQARAAKRGLWALKFDRPSEWRAKHPRPIESTQR